MDVRRILAYSKHLMENIITFIKWIFFGCLIGVVVGLVGTSFYKLIEIATELRNQNGWLLYFLPIGGIVIAMLYKYWMKSPDRGTNLVLASIAAKEEITPKLAPLIYISTVITHLFGGSAGKEGAAFQIGGGIANMIGRWFKLDESDKHTLIMCGMSAGFGALFGTPMASTIFAMEIISVGVMYYGALVPCMVASYVSVAIAKFFKTPKEAFDIGVIPDADIKTILLVGLLIVLCAGLSGVFCFSLHESGKLYREKIKNPFIRVVAGAIFVIVLTKLLGTTAYNGGGNELIEQCFDGKVSYLAFFFKMLFTCLTIGAGFKGGEIIPSLTVGATFGYTFGAIAGLPLPFASAIGMIAVFCGVTNCPITTLLLAFEMFGFDGSGYMAIAVAVSYMLSGYYGLYASQKIMYSKMKTSYINRRINNKVE